jgi:C4-dicarboxylate-specific signal transduction histidine kinase
MEASVQLQQLNQTLRQRTAELANANERWQQEIRRRQGAEESRQEQPAA